MQQTIVQIILENYLFIAISFSVLVGFVAKFNFQIGGHPVLAVYEFWINFSGAAIGWLALYSYLLLLLQLPLLDITFAHIVLLLFGLYGIVGFLPRLLINVLDALGRITSTILNKITG